MIAKLRGRLPGFIWLTVLWVALWGTVEAGTVLAGAGLGAGVLFIVRRFTARQAPRIRPLLVLRYAAAFAVMLVQSTISVAKVVLRPRIDIQPAVVPTRLPPTSPFVATLVANSVTLTPGTLTLDVIANPDDSFTLVVHALDAPDIGAVSEDVLRLYRLAAAAFHVKEEIAG